MENLFRLEVDTGSGGYGFTDTFDELLEDVEYEYGEKTRDEVKEWALNSNVNDEFNKDGMYITNLGKEE
jgi:hypothetical protein